MKIKALLTILSLLLHYGCAENDTTSPSSSATSPYLSCNQITSNNTSPIGTNLTKWSYFNDSDWTVIDAFSKSSSWNAFSPTAGWSEGSITSSDSKGWPTGVSGDTRPSVQLFSGIDGAYPAGTYIIYWEGSGGSVYVDDDNANLRCIDGSSISSCSSKKGYFEVTPTSAGILLGITPDDASTYSSSNYIKNIRVIVPGGICGRSSNDLDYFEYCETSRGGSGSCDSGETCYDFDEVHWNRFSDSTDLMQDTKVVFHPLHLNKIRKFRAIRYMDWLNMQGTNVSSWDDKTAVDNYSLAVDNGVPPIYVVKHANSISADTWINVPHLATNDYNDQFAALVLANLNSNLNIYLEYTNEHYNPDTSEFPQSTYMLTQANNNNLGSGQSDLIKKNIYYATRSVEIFDRWTTVFGTQNSRIIRVLGGWLGMPAVGTTMLAVNGVADKTDALAIGVYFGMYIPFPEYESIIETWTVDQLFNEFTSGGLDATNENEAASGAVAQVKTYIDQYTAITNNYDNIDLVAYESGTHLWASNIENNTAIKTLFETANRDARLANIYYDVYTHWKNSGGTHLNHFIQIRPWRFDQFGSLPNHDAVCNDYPKYSFLNYWIENAPCWWDNC